MPGPTAGTYTKKQIKDLIRFRPGNLSLYIQALTPKSSIPATENGSIDHNERLEYLGDAILEAVITDLLFREFPNQDEGFLTKVRAKFVNRKHLNKIGKDLGLERYIEPPAHQNQHKKNLFGDTVEALIGAVYLDKGFIKAQKFIQHILIEDLQFIVKKETDYKSQIVELAQKHKCEVGFETKTKEEDQKIGDQFFANLSFNSKFIGAGQGSSKKEAEQKAAYQALEYIRQHPAVLEMPLHGPEES